MPLPPPLQPDHFLPFVSVLHSRNTINQLTILLTKQVNEQVGTYFYHDHSNLNRADGLQGALIVKERPGSPQLFEADADETLLLSDWWHFNGNAMALRLNRCAA